MEETKFVKAYCDKINQYFGLEVKKVGGKWVVVNVTHLTSAEAGIAASEVEQASFQTHTTLLPCLNCGSRNVGGCSCSMRNHPCTRGMKYQFDCIYCKNLKIDYSLPSSAEAGLRVGETVTLAQGQEVKIRFSDDRPLTEILVGVGWDPATGSHNMDVDSSVVLLSSDARHRDLIYFGNKTYPTGCIIHHGDDLVGDHGVQGGDDETISVYLNKVPDDRDRLVFVLNIYQCDERHQTLDKVKNLFIRLCDPTTKKSLVEYRVNGNMGRDTALVIGVATRKQGGWTFKAIGRSLRVLTVKELAERCKDYL